MVRRSNFINATMQPTQRIMTVTPIHELWNDRGTVNASRSLGLAADEIRDLLRRGPLRFVVVEAGFKPRWLPEADCYAFWKTEVQSHLVAHDMPARLDDFPNGYRYFASEWSPASGSPIVVLETQH
jgi:hypothetical protein